MNVVNGCLRKLIFLGGGPYKIDFQQNCNCKEGILQWVPPCVRCAMTRTNRLEHIMTSCYFFSSSLWWMMSEWCNIPPLFFFAVEDMFFYHKSVQAVLLASCWILWKTRKEEVFSSK
ncbi:hypothetical protein HanIR_Chr09g0427551 [Helianthus annuus]|nr:hypothetical protein HanIR_Chr09g0427551 [Helianthus annuus]